MKTNQSLSDISRTNQLKITEPLDDLSEKLYQYLFRIGKGIETFNIGNLDLSEYDDSSLTYFQKRHRAINSEIKKRLSSYTGNKYSDIKYFLSQVDGKNYVFFLTPNATHSGWKQLFCDIYGCYNREKILNLIFKIHLLSSGLDALDFSANNFEELPKLLIVHSQYVTRSNNLIAWGLELYLNYNPHGVVTLTLSRTKLKFVSEDEHKTLDGDDMGSVLLYKEKKYYCSQRLDGRDKNQIKFMRFDSDDDGYAKFKKTQLYHYQNLMTKLENFFTECGITYQPLPFQADHYLENPFIRNIESVDSLEIINNSGTDFTETDKQFFVNFLRHQGVSSIKFYFSGKTISTYEPLTQDGEATTCWKISQVIPWADVPLDKNQNYLVLNKAIDEESGSMAYSQDGNQWYPSTKIDNKPFIDFYSQLKMRLNYINSKVFYSIQGMNITEFKAVGTVESERSILNYPEDRISMDALHQDTRSFTNGKRLDPEDAIYYYLAGQQDVAQIDSFYKTHKIEVSTEFQKVLIEIGIKNWIGKSFSMPGVGLAINPQQTFSEKTFFAIYVRSPRNQDAKAISVKFLYKEGYIYIKEVLCDIKEIETRFPILKKRRKNPQQFKEQQYFVDEDDKIYISCYTDDYYTPTLIGRMNIIEDLEEGTLEINRRKDNNLLPLVISYNSDVKQVKNLICLDLKNDTFIQYYVPPAQSPRNLIKNGFRVYHMIGSSYSKEQMSTKSLVNHPIVSLHFSTLTQNILKINENSQSSLLQKVAKVFIEN